MCRAVFHSWRVVHLNRVAEACTGRAKTALEEKVAAVAVNNKWRKKVGETIFPQLQQKKAAVRKRWKETRITIDRHLVVLQTGCDMLEASDIDGWRALHHAASQGFEKLVRALLTAGKFSTSPLWSNNSRVGTFF